MNTIDRSSKEKMLRQVLREAGIITNLQKQALTKQFEKRFIEVTGLVTEHRRRQQRFTESQNKVLAKHYATIERAKQSIEQKQQQAIRQKDKSLEESQKRRGLEEERWKNIVKMN